MTGRSEHFEVYVRKIPGGSWALEQASENRATAIATAEDLMKEGKVAAAKVTKETFDEETREFRTVTILKLGQADVAAKSRPQAEPQPLCVTPQDLYTVHARERIGRLLEAWLERNNATPFELLHRADLVEKLEASGIELQHAIQKIAVPEAHARGMSVHELIRVFHALIDRAVDRLMKDTRKGVIPNLDKEGFAPACERVLKDPERGYLLGGAVAASIASAATWGEKVGRLLDLADAAPKTGGARALALAVLEQPLAEILECKGGIGEVLGKDMGLGESLAAMTRLAAFDAVDKLIAVEPAVAKVMPQLSPMSERLAKWLNTGFTEVRAALGRRMLRELNGPRRLCPGDAPREITVLRALAMSLTAAAGKLMPLEDVQAAFSARSRMLVTGDFVESYLGQDKTAREEVEALIWLTENVIGGANKRQAGAWLQAVVHALKFEKETVLADFESPTARLAELAKLQRDVARCGLVPEDFEPIQAKMGELGGLIEARAKITVGLARAQAPIVNRLGLLLKLAMGEAAPLGPAADRARAEALKLVRNDETRAELSRSPEQMSAVRDLIQQSGLAA